MERWGELGAHVLGIDLHGAISGDTSSRLVVIALWGVDLVFAMDSVASKLASAARPQHADCLCTNGVPVAQIVFLVVWNMFLFSIY